MLARLCYSGLDALGVPALARRLGRGGLVLCYHNVVGGAGASGSRTSSVHMPLAQFERQLRWVAGHYRMVPLADLVTALREGKSLRRLAAVTFDDGYTGVLKHAWPLLRALGVPATIFVVSDAPETRAPFWWDHPALPDGRARVRWLAELRGDGAAILQDANLGPSRETAAECRPASWDDLSAAARDGVSLGVHSATHRSLPYLSDAELVDEVVTSRRVIAERTGTAPDCFAHPYGLWDARVRAAVQEAGYRGACTLDYGLVHTGADPWALPRVNVPAGISRPAFAAWTAGLNLRGAARA